MKEGTDIVQGKRTLQNGTESRCWNEASESHVEL